MIMTDKELNISLREMARMQGLCDQWYSEWGDNDSLDDCLDRYIRGFDFVQERDWPPLEFIRKHFDKELLHKHHIYLDEKVAINHAESGFYVFLGDCTGYIHADGYCAATIYLKHNSNIKVTVADAARLFLHYFDKSSGVVKEIGCGRIRCYDKRKKEG